MAKLFKTIDPTHAYIHAELGSDLFGDGTIDRPYASHAKATTKSIYKILRGTLIENGVGRTYGDEKYQTVVCSTNIGNSQNLRARTIGDSQNCIVSGDMTRSSGCICGGSAGWTDCNNSTTREVRDLSSTVDLICYDKCYVISGANKGYWVLPSSCIFYWNNTLIQSPVWVNDSFENIRLLKKVIEPGWSEIGANTIIDNFFGTINVNGQKIETCQIVWEQKDGGVLPNIFAAYEVDGVTPSDLHLNPDLNNVALRASETGNFVGALPPAQTKTISNTFKNVNANGTITTANGLIMSIDPVTGLLTNNLDPTTYNGQEWNRFTAPVSGDLGSQSTFKGVNNMNFATGQTSGVYIGKNQPLFGPELFPKSGIFSLEANKRYKVIDISPDSTFPADTGITIKKEGTMDVQVGRSGVFFTALDITGYTFQANNSQVSIVEVLATPFESVECTAYVNGTTPSSLLPRFSCPMNEDVLILYHRQTDTPVLFSEIANNKHAYFQNFAVSNADSEYYALITDTVNYISKPVNLRYCQIEVNIHFDKLLRI